MLSVSPVLLFYKLKDRQKRLCGEWRCLRIFVQGRVHRVIVDSTYGHNYLL